MGISEIALFDDRRRLGSYSNKISKFKIIDLTPESLYTAIIELHREYSSIVVFPTDDLHIEFLHQLYDKICSFCYIPFNVDNVLECVDKSAQYSYCEVLGVPYPDTVVLRSKSDFDRMVSLRYPILIKPSTREDNRRNVFRNLQLKSPEDFAGHRRELEQYISHGITFLASEVIPGDGSNIYAYVGYRNREGVLLNEWTGKKLSQFPDEFGVFASASNSAPSEILYLGRKLLEGMNIVGIAEPEFKYDCRDGAYKLIEINLRSMMWHRVGCLAGVNLHASQYFDALGLDVARQTQIKDKNIHYVYLKHEVINLLSRKGYRRVFLHNILDSDKTYFALLDLRDPLPFLIDFKSILKNVVLICLKKLKGD